jgi:hypothetical protein
VVHSPARDTRATLLENARTFHPRLPIIDASSCSVVDFGTHATIRK